MTSPPAAARVLTRFRLGLLAGASLIAPTLGIVARPAAAATRHGGRPRGLARAVRPRRRREWPGSMRQQERSLERERMLSAAGADARRRDEPGGDRRGRARRPHAPWPGAGLCVDAMLPPCPAAGGAARGCASSPLLDGRRGRRGRQAAPERAHGARRCRADARRACWCSTWRRSAPERVLLVVAGRTTSAGGRPRVAARARRAGRACARARDAHRGGAPPPRRGALRLARAPRQRPDHRDRPRRHDQLPEPVDRARCSATPPRTWSGGASTSSSTARTATACGEMLADAASLGREQPEVAPVHAGAPGRRRSISSRSTAPTCSTTSTSAASSSTAATSASARRSRSSSRIRHSTTRSPASPTARYSPSASGTRSRARAASTRASPSSSSTSTTSRRSTTASVMRPATRCCVEVAKRLATSIRATRHGGALRRRRVRAAARGHRRTSRRRPTPRSACSRRSRCRSAVAHKELVAALQHRHLRRLARTTPAGAEELIRDADAAMYRAKRDGKGSYRLFEPEMHEGVLARLELRTDLQRAIATEQLELHYQPVVRIHDGSISGVEALLRWRHPERGHDPARPVHPARRGDGPDHPDRALGAARGLPARAPHARRACRPRRR